MTIGVLAGETRPKGSFFCLVLTGVSNPALALNVSDALLTGEALNVLAFFFYGAVLVFLGAFFLIGFFATFFTAGSSFLTFSFYCLSNFS